METIVDQIKDSVQGATRKVEDAQNVGNAERIVSLLAGVLLTYYGMQKKGTLLGKGLTFAGGLLITRGSTGYCPVNNALERNSILS